MVTKIKKGIAEQAYEFLESGKDGGIDINKLAAECELIVRSETEKSSSRAVQLGKSYVRQARPYGGAILQRAYRALGWAFLVGGHFSKAEELYLRARDLVRRDAKLRGQIDRVLIDVYMYLGNFKEARRRATLSLATFRRLGSDFEAAKTRVNYANLLHRQDRHREANMLYHEAGKYFESRDSRLFAAYCYYNEANTLVQLFDFDGAASLYRRAERIFREHGHDLRANGCQYGLAWLYMLENNYHSALRILAACEENYQRAAQPREVVLCMLDRAEGYLALNLFSDAGFIAQKAERQADKLGISYESAKAALFYSKACLSMGRLADARRALKRAEAGFAAEKNNAFQAAVELVSIQIDRDKGTRSSRIVAARKRFSKAQLPLWEAICDLQIISHYPDDPGAFRRLAKNPAVKGVPHLYAFWKTISGDREIRRGRLDSAIKHWALACEVLDAVRAKLPPIDMRTAFLKNQGDPHCKLIGAELTRRPVVAAAWSERYKTAGLWRAFGKSPNNSSIRMKAEKGLSELASRITTLSIGLSHANRKKAAISLYDDKIFQILQEKIRCCLAELEISAETRVDKIDTVIRQIRTTAGRIPIIQFHAGGEDLIAFVHNGIDTHFHRYVNGARMARHLVGRWRFMIERAPFLKGGYRSSDLKDEKRLLKQIGEWLLTPLEIPSEAKELLILPEGDITNIPWQAIIYKGRALVADRELLLSPSLRHYWHARDLRTRSKRIEVFVGDGRKLSKNKREFEVLFQAGNGNLKVHSPCYREDWPDSGRARLWHYSGHAQWRKDNPFYSSLTLADGPMFAADFRLKSNRVMLITLAACRTGQQSYLPGEESTGLVRSLLEMGARSVLASHWAVSDKSTSVWMNEFYRNFFSGEAVTSAVRKAALVLQEKHPSAYHWAAFSAYGAG